LPDSLDSPSGLRFRWAWATDDETAFLEFDRVLLYLGVVVFTALLGVRNRIPRWADGFAIAITAIAALALVSRLFPGALSVTPLGRYLPGTGTRLSYPLNYWNGLAVLTALGLPFLLRVAVAAGPALVRGAAVAPIPAFTAVIYLASSRGGAVAAAVAMVVFTVIVDARWRAAGAVLCGAAGSLLVVHALRVRPILSDGPFTTHEAALEGRRVAIIVLLVCVLTGLLFRRRLTTHAGRGHAAMAQPQRSHDRRPRHGGRAHRVSSRATIPCVQDSRFGRSSERSLSGIRVRPHLQREWQRALAALEVGSLRVAPLSGHRRRRSAPSTPGGCNGTP